MPIPTQEPWIAISADVAAYVDSGNGAPDTDARNGHIVKAGDAARSAWADFQTTPFLQEGVTEHAADPTSLTARVLEPRLAQSARVAGRGYSSLRVPTVCVAAAHYALSNR